MCFKGNVFIPFSPSNPSLHSLSLRSISKACNSENWSTACVIWKLIMYHLSKPSWIRYMIVLNFPFFQIQFKFPKFSFSMYWCCMCGKIFMDDWNNKWESKEEDGSYSSKHRSGSCVVLLQIGQLAWRVSARRSVFHRAAGLMCK
jgi:hypothetical protein